MEVYESSEYVKFLVDTSVDWTTKTTYMGYANYDWEKAFTDNADTAKPIWKIRKIVEDTNSGELESFYADGSSSFDYVRDNRESLNYV